MRTPRVARCHYCKVAPGTTRDHVIPKSWHGRGKRNLVPACPDCNQQKGDQAPTCLCDYCRAAVGRWLKNVIPEILKTCPPTQRDRWARRRWKVILTYHVEAA